MADIINYNNLNNVVIHGDIWNTVYDNLNDIEMCEL